MQLAIAGRAARETVRYGKRPTITGKLECAGVPMIAAAVTISGGGLNTSVTTSTLGTFTYQVPGGPAALSPSATGRSPTTAHLRRSPARGDRRTAQDCARDLATPHLQRRDHRLGRARRGGPYPPGGVTLLIEVREGNRWQPFDQIVAPAGRFRYRYTFLRTTVATTYRFRVALPANGAGGYDYAPGASNTVAVHVR